MKETIASKFLIIGPPLDAPIADGTVSHMNFLASLKIFQEAAFYPFPLKGKYLYGIPAVFAALVKLHSTEKKKPHAGVLINAMIYKTSLIKLFLQLAVLSPTSNIYIFFHGGHFTKVSHLRFSLIRKAFHSLLAKAARIFFLNETQLREFKTFFPDIKAEYYQNYSSKDSLLFPTPAEKGKIRVFYAGRAIKEKGLLVLIDALASLPASPPGTQYDLFIAGHGNDFQAIQNYAFHKLPRDNVHFYGLLNKADLEEAYRNAEIFVFPSLYEEGFPYALIDAFRAGLPVITTPQSALTPFFKENVNGITISPRDSRSLAKAVSYLASDTALRNSIADNNRALFQKRFTKNQAELFYSGLFLQRSGTEAPLRP